MQQTDLRRLTTDSLLTAGSGGSPPPSHASQVEWTLTHRIDALPERHAWGWESAWIDLGGEG
jgi:hypothetical protein